MMCMLDVLLSGTRSKLFAGIQLLKTCIECTIPSILLKKASTSSSEKSDPSASLGAIHQDLLQLERVLAVVEALLVMAPINIRELSEGTYHSWQGVVECPWLANSDREKMMKWSAQDVAIGFLLLALLMTTGQSLGDGGQYQQLPHRQLLDPEWETSNPKWALSFFGDKFGELAANLTSGWIKTQNVFSKNKLQEIPERSWRQWKAFIEDAIIKGKYLTQEVTQSDFYKCAKSRWSQCVEQMKGLPLAVPWCTIVLRWECELSTGNRQWNATYPWSSLQ
ncbi:hypothetical protein NE237_006829 [Protea cynaroides]|uniref:Uncharacterized protein n=1 Tax=Protea cynaroides TaxID=273540 RepID=A0A9Q0KNB3_9MAGN|nr:hypothetical protein NE237_006829 [Protea cynaroides]